MSLSRVALVVVGVFAIAEIVLLAWLSQAIGVGWTLAILAAGAVVGGLIWRHEGNKAWASLREAQSDPQRATAQISDTAMVFTGGLLFLIPGLISDVLGLICVLPFTRGLARRGVRAAFAGLTRPYRDQADLLAARLEPDTVVEGQTIPDPPRPGSRRPRPDDPTVIKGEIEP